MIFLWLQASPEFLINSSGLLRDFNLSPNPHLFLCRLYYLLHLSDVWHLRECDLSSCMLQSYVFPCQCAAAKLISVCPFPLLSSWRLCWPWPIIGQCIFSLLVFVLRSPAMNLILALGHLMSCPGDQRSHLHQPHLIPLLQDAHWM